VRIEVINPHGFCGGVERAIRMANDLLDRAEGAVYGLHEIVHNEVVVRGLTSKGMVFVESVSEVPEGATMLVSAHGTSPATFEEAEKRGIRVVDATCPFVAVGHGKIRENFRNGMRTVVIGAATHAEVRGYLGEKGACLPEDVRPGERTGRVVQTTLDSGEYEGVCTATKDRQNAVFDFVHSNVSRGVVPSAIGVLVVGSMKSSNTGRLADVASRNGAKVWRVASPDDILQVDFSGVEVLGVTSGSSTPDDVFQDVLARIA
jgi:4-hydroxy-3-methylbut-2-enyl diphosphate reductase